MKLGQYFLDLCKKLSYFILLGEDEPILTNIFQMGWFNHQLVYFWLRSYTYTCWWFHVFLKCHPYLGNDSQFHSYFLKNGLVQATQPSICFFLRFWSSFCSSSPSSSSPADFEASQVGVKLLELMSYPCRTALTRGRMRKKHPMEVVVAHDGSMGRVWYIYLHGWLIFRVN